MQDSISTSEFMEQQVVETSSVFTDFSTIAAIAIYFWDKQHTSLSTNILIFNSI